MIKIVYIGILSSDVRGIEDLCNAVISIEKEMPKTFSVDFYGFGPLKDFLVDLAGRYECIKFHGKLESGRQREVYLKYDIMAAFYYTHNCPVHVYAAPNKFFDHLNYGLPILTNNGHSFADEIKNLASGILTEENKNSIQKSLMEYATYKLNINKIQLTDLLNKYRKKNYNTYCILLK